MQRFIGAAAGGTGGVHRARKEGAVMASPRPSGDNTSPEETCGVTGRFSMNQSSPSHRTHASNRASGAFLNHSGAAPELSRWHRARPARGVVTETRFLFDCACPASLSVSTPAWHHPAASQPIREFKLSKLSTPRARGEGKRARGEGKHSLISAFPRPDLGAGCTVGRGSDLRAYTIL
jgi:hypothetical protein